MKLVDLVKYGYDRRKTERKYESKAVFYLPAIPEDKGKESEQRKLGYMGSLSDNPFINRYSLMYLLGSPF